MKQQEGGRGDLPPPLEHCRRGGRGVPPLGFEHISSPGEEEGGVPPSPAPRIDPTKNEQTIGLDPANSFESFMTSQFVF